MMDNSLVAFAQVMKEWKCAWNALGDCLLNNRILKRELETKNRQLSYLRRIHGIQHPQVNSAPPQNAGPSAHVHRVRRLQTSSVQGILIFIF